MTKDRDCSIELLELSLGLGGWKNVFEPFSKCNCLVNFYVSVPPYDLIAFFPMLDNEFWDLQNLHWEIVKSLFTFSNHELNAGTISQQSWNNVFLDIIIFFQKERQLVINKYIWGQVTIPKKTHFLFYHMN